LNDDCEAFGATIGGIPTASFGTIATQSFYWSHQLSAIEGGAALTDDDELAVTMRMLRDHGMTRSVKKASNFDEEYDFRLFGYNVRPLEMHMAIARVQLRKADMHKAARRRNWSRFANAVKDLPVKLPTMGDGASPFSLHFECETPRARAALVASLRSSRIDCRLPTGGSFHLHAYGGPWRHQATPRADKIHRTGLFLGNAPYDIEEQIATAADVMKETFEWLT
jgi:CDP-6-deoxy-D-xylo-4-hexulose-3-dehydrase